MLGIVAVKRAASRREHAASPDLKHVPIPQKLEHAGWQAAHRFDGIAAASAVQPKRLRQHGQGLGSRYTVMSAVLRQGVRVGAALVRAAPERTIQRTWSWVSRRSAALFAVSRRYISTSAARRRATACAAATMSAPLTPRTSDSA